MKAAVPVTGESLEFFGNAGHTPMFALFEIVGSGMFRSFKLEELRPNPRNDIDHTHDDESHECSHDSGDEEHVRQHQVMAAAIEDADYLVTRRACKNTALSMKDLGISIIKYGGSATDAKSVLAEVSAQLS